MLFVYTQADSGPQIPNMSTPRCIQVSNASVSHIRQQHLQIKDTSDKLNEKNEAMKTFLMTEKKVKITRRSDLKKIYTNLLSDEKSQQILTDTDQLRSELNRLIGDRDTDLQTLKRLVSMCEYGCIEYVCKYVCIDVHVCVCVCTCVCICQCVCMCVHMSVCVHEGSALRTWSCV